MTLDAWFIAPAGRLRRAAAFATDLVLLGLVGHAFGYAFFGIVTGWGPYGTAFGLVLMLAYFAISASPAMAGRTLGKRIWGLEVARIGGGQLPFAQALGRAAFVSLPYLANGWTAKETVLIPAVNVGITLMVAGVGGAMLYLFFFNRSTGQALHDLVFGTVVVKSGAPVPSTPRALPRVHMVALACIMAMLLGLNAVSTVLMKTWLGGQWTSSTALWESLNLDPRFFSVSVNHHTLTRGANTTTTVTVHAWLKAWSGDRAAVTLDLAARVLDHYKEREPDNLQIALVHGYDLGVASWQTSSVDAGSVEKWRGRFVAGLPDAVGPEPAP